MAKILRYRSRGGAVRELQRLLNNWGFGPLVEDGIFGRGTRRSVQQFQAAQGLSPDGVAGPNTWAALAAPRGGTSPQPVTPSSLPSAASEVLDIAQGLSGPAGDVVRVAAVDIGKREIPDGSNAGPEIAHLVEGYREHWRWAPGSAYPPWCALGLSRWIGYALDLPPPGPSAWDTPWTELHPFGAWLGSAKSIEDWARARGRLLPPEQARPGDVMTMGRLGSGSDASRSENAGHVGLVYKVESWGSLTVECNVSNAVLARRRLNTGVRHAVRVFG